MDRVLNSTGDVWFDAETCSIEEFSALVEVGTQRDDVPLAADVAANIPIYDAESVRVSRKNPAEIRAYMAEWQRVLEKGPGIVVFKKAYEETGVIDDVTEVLNKIIEEEGQQIAGSGDHFAPAGANSRVWNAHEKLCIANPELFALYNANGIIPLISQSWLGPYYQITTQVNVVRPGGKAQTCHRDYHMGFQKHEELVRYPAHIHALTPALTLQGAVAHCDMPIESGPTKLLPFSQTYEPGFLAALLPEFRDYFEDNYAQLPLEKGDALFFNPAVFHAAGENVSTDTHRFANLMQIGSGYGRSIEILDRTRMSRVLYPALLSLATSGRLDGEAVENVIAACAEGYPFPANLDIDSPLSGMAPESQQELMRRAVKAQWSTDRFLDALEEQAGRKRSH